MVSALVSVSSRPGSRPASLHPGVEMSTGKFNAGDNPVMD